MKNMKQTHILFIYLVFCTLTFDIFNVIKPVHLSIIIIILKLSNNILFSVTVDQLLRY